MILILKFGGEWDSIMNVIKPNLNIYTPHLLTDLDPVIVIQ